MHETILNLPHSICTYVHTLSAYVSCYIHFLVDTNLRYTVSRPNQLCSLTSNLDLPMAVPGGLRVLHVLKNLRKLLVGDCDCRSFHNRFHKTWALRSGIRGWRPRFSFFGDCRVRGGSVIYTILSARNKHTG
jgi:hypothetical protein